jgi:hypothetical protein
MLLVFLGIFSPESMLLVFLGKSNCSYRNQCNCTTVI